LLGGDGFGDEFGEGVLPPLEDLPPLAAYDALDPIKEAETKDDGVEKMETDEAPEEKKTTEEAEDSPELAGKILVVNMGTGLKTVCVSLW
jgi:hypothetical protein